MMTASVACLTLLVSTCLTQSQQQSAASPSRSEDSLRTFLQNYLEDPTLGEDQTTRYITAFVDLKDDGKKEVIVYITGRWWCGSGGCRTLVLARAASSYRVVSNILVTRPPIFVLAGKSHGWHDIGVWVQGGGIRPGYEAELRFDGKTYPMSPANPPAVRLTGHVAGEVVISPSEEGIPLYP